MNTCFVLLIILAILVTSLFICNVFAKRLGIDLKNTKPKDIPLQLWIVALTSTIMLCGAGTVLLVNIIKLEYNIFSGFFLGLGAVLIGLLFNFLAFVPHKNGLPILYQYFRHPMYWLTYLCIIVTCTLVGFLGQILKIHSS